MDQALLNGALAGPRPGSPACPSCESPGLLLSSSFRKRGPASPEPHPDRGSSQPERRAATRETRDPKPGPGPVGQEGRRPSSQWYGEHRARAVRPEYPKAQEAALTAEPGVHDHKHHLPTVEPGPWSRAGCGARALGRRPDVGPGLCLHCHRGEVGRGGTSPAAGGPGWGTAGGTGPPGLPTGTRTPTLRTGDRGWCCRRCPTGHCWPTTAASQPVMHPRAGPRSRDRMVGHAGCVTGPGGRKTLAQA